MSTIETSEVKGEKDIETEKSLQFLNYVNKLKHLDRAGWLRYEQIKKPVESVAGHMYRMAIMSAFFIDDEDLDLNKCIKMSLVHDIGESIIGDITPFDNVDDKTKNEIETEAIDKLSKLLPNPKKAIEMKQLFLEYEEGVTKEAQLVKQLDKLDMLIQAYEYEKESKDSKNPLFLQDFFDSTSAIFTEPKSSDGKSTVVNPQIKEIFSKIVQERSSSSSN